MPGAADPVKIFFSSSLMTTLLQRVYVGGSKNWGAGAAWDSHAVPHAAIEIWSFWVKQ